MAPQHKRAIKVLAITLALIVVLGIAFALQQHIGIGYGIYYALTTATTVGYGDITPHGIIGYALAMLMMCTVVPLLTATYSLLTSGLTTTELRAHVDKRLDDHHDKIRQHITEAGNGGTEGSTQGPGGAGTAEHLPDPPV